MGVTTKGVAFNNDLVAWKFNRRIISSTIMVPSFLRQFVNESEKVFQEFEIYWINLTKENNNYVLNFPDWSTRFFADAISLASIGKPAHMMATQYNRLVPKDLKTLNSKPGLYQFEEFLDRIRLWLKSNPEKKAKVYAEIDNVFKGDKIRPMTYDDIEKLVYVEAAAKESSRLMPIVPSVFKRAINDVMIGGLNWKTGQEFFVHQHYIHHNKSHWSNPEEFIPERFLGGTNKIEKNSFIPFGGGIRQCPGRHLGMTGIKTFIALLFRKYDVSLEDPKAPLKKVYTLANECHELKLYIQPRKD
ncbi:3275_t:CDS:2 [Gigaspora rosea]|nr:3275_t:CDS:2 [Gigaspora rosea]